MEIMTSRAWPVVLLGIVLSACAASPQKPAPVVVAAPAAAQKPGGPNELTAPEVERKAREMGYHVETQDGGKRGYCRNTAPTGSHISRKECLSPTAMAQAVQKAEEIQSQISQRNGQSCTGCARD